MIWNFGKLDVKFRKPLDPTNLSPSNKNVQKDKMEPSFPVEESPNKNIIVRRNLNKFNLPHIVFFTLQWNLGRSLRLFLDLLENKQGEYVSLP
jgi:hypothetical protein